MERNKEVGIMQKGNINLLFISHNLINHDNLVQKTATITFVRDI